MKSSIAVTTLAAVAWLAPTFVAARDSPYLLFRIRPKASKSKSSGAKVNPPSSPTHVSSSPSTKASKKIKPKCAYLMDESQPTQVSQAMSLSYSLPHPNHVHIMSRGPKGSKRSKASRTLNNSKGSKRGSYDGGIYVKKGKTIKCDDIVSINGDGIVARDDLASVLSTANQTLIDVLENDTSNPPDQVLVLNTVITSDPTKGTCALNEERTAVIYSPPSDPLFAGEATCEYEACIESDDLDLTCDRAMLTISVGPSVVARDDEASILSSSAGTLIEVLNNDSSNPCGHSLIVKAISIDPSHGTSTITEDKKAVLFTPPSGFIGETSFEYVTCTSEEQEPSCDKANVTIIVNTATPTGAPTSSPVVAVDDEASILSTIPENQIVINVLENDSTNPAGQELIVTAITIDPSHGKWTLNEGSTAVVYSPPSDFIGETFFEYEACTTDELEPNCDRANVTISVNTAAPTGAPTPSSVVAVDDEVSVLSAGPELVINVLENDRTDPAGLQLIVKAITGNPSHGICTINEDSTAMIYSPPSGFIGDTSFEYEACIDDGVELTCDRANVTIFVIEPTAAEPSTSSPTKYPTKAPEDQPTMTPTSVPSMRIPTDHPSVSSAPSSQPSLSPTASGLPSLHPSFPPSMSSAPSSQPTAPPSVSSQPSNQPSMRPSHSTGPTSQPSNQPSVSAKPSSQPSLSPTNTGAPTSKPSELPSVSSQPSLMPTHHPSVSSAPTSQPSLSPTASGLPSLQPTAPPSISLAPSSQPSDSPSVSAKPSSQPSMGPSESTSPTKSPSLSPITPPPVQVLVCISDRHFKDGNGHNCKYYQHPKVKQGCSSEEHDTDGWVNAKGETPWEACCFCGGGTIGLPPTPPPTKAKTAPTKAKAAESVSNDKNPSSAPVKRRLGSRN